MQEQNVGGRGGQMGYVGKAAQKRCAVQNDPVDLLGLGARSGEPAADLGFADAKLLEIARAMAAKPRVLLLDEPIAGVPLADQNRILEVVRAINAEGVTIVLVEHNMRVVMSACHDILVVNHGKRLAEGTPAEMVRHPEVIRAYLGGEAQHA